MKTVFVDPLTITKPETIDLWKIGPGNFHNPKSIIEAMYEPTPYRWFDRLTLQPDSQLSELQFFKVPMNGNVDGRLKTHADTNMRQGEQFTPPFCFLTYQIGFEVTGASQQYLNRFYASCCMNFQVLGKVFAQTALIPTGRHSGFMDESGNPCQFEIEKLSAQERLGYDRFGFSVPQAGFRFPISRPFFIPTLTNFGVSLLFPHGIPASKKEISVLAYLDGITELPIC
jgi:hypothetical protein